MKTRSFLLSWLVVLSPAGLRAAAPVDTPAPSTGRKYSIVVEGFDWGAGVSKAILALEGKVSEAKAGDFAVSVKRHTDCHWSWIYLHANKCRLDFDGKPVTLEGRPVTIMEWLAAQSKGGK
jgi:hypothetical protein